ncbi:MAG: anti-sigma factor [Ferruginibacter sp.]
MEIKDIISSGLLEAYTMGLTSPEETANVQAWIKQYPEVAAELNSIEKTMESYAMAYAVEPGKDVKDKIFSKIETNHSVENYTTSAKVYPINPFWKWAAAASIVLLIGSAVLNYVYYNKYTTINTAYQQTQQQIEDQNSKIAQMNSDLNTMNNDMSVVQSKYSEPVALHGLEAAPDAGAKIFWMKNTGDVYIDPTNLPEAPAGKQYQLWAIVDGKPVDGGMIVQTKKGDKYQIQKMKSFGKAQAFAVTLETQGGNPTPKGTMYVMGKM